MVETIISGICILLLVGSTILFTWAEKKDENDKNKNMENIEPINKAFDGEEKSIKDIFPQLTPEEEALTGIHFICDKLNRTVSSYFCQIMCNECECGRKIEVHCKKDLSKRDIIEWVLTKVCKEGNDLVDEFNSYNMNKCLDRLEKELEEEL